jgi:hypothetical protein
MSPGGTRKMIFVVTSIQEGDGCHACNPYVRVFEFQPQDARWVLTGSGLAVFRWGQWGELAPGELTVVDLGAGKYAAMLDGGSTGQGIYESSP